MFTCPQRVSCVHTLAALIDRFQVTHQAIVSELLPLEVIASCFNVVLAETVGYHLDDLTSFSLDTRKKQSTSISLPFTARTLRGLISN